MELGERVGERWCPAFLQRSHQQLHNRAYFHDPAPRTKRPSFQRRWNNSPSPGREDRDEGIVPLTFKDQYLLRRLHPFAARCRLGNIHHHITHKPLPKYRPHPIAVPSPVGRERVRVRAIRARFQAYSTLFDPMTYTHPPNHEASQRSGHYLRHWNWRMKTYAFCRKLKIDLFAEFSDNWLKWRIFTNGATINSHISGRTGKAFPIGICRLIWSHGSFWHSSGCYSIIGFRKKSIQTCIGGGL